MTRHRAPAPASRRRPASGRTGGARGVAAALAVALLAGLVTFWLTRPSDALSGVPAAEAIGASSLPVETTSPAGPADAPPADSTSQPRTRPATQVASAARPAPTRLTIERLDVDMPVRAVGVGRDGAMALPRSPAELGWYRFGARPGDSRGATVLAAHLDMPGYGVGPIAAVERLRRGDILVVRSGGTTTRYAVSDVRSIRKSQLDLPALFSRNGAPVLHLLTCAGAFDREARAYDRNVVVTATPVS